MKIIKQWAKHKLPKKLLMGVLTFAVIGTMITYRDSAAYGGSSYHINTTDLTNLQSYLSSIATVSKDDNTITITLKSNVSGMLVFNVNSEATFILDAAGFTINGSGQNEAVQLANGNDATVILKGNGTYQPGYNNTIYGGGGDLIIESGIFHEPNSGYYTIRSYANFRLAEGYDYYTVTTKNEGDLFQARNIKNKSSSYISASEGQLVVSQCKGEISCHSIEALSTTNGSYTFLVNGEVASTARVDDKVTVSFTPDTYYRYSGLIVKSKNSGATYIENRYRDISIYDFEMPDYDISLDVSFDRQNQITTQPTAENPTVVTDNPEGVSSYQWYTTYVEEHTLVDGDAGPGEVSVDQAINGTFNSLSKTWSSDNNRIELIYYDVNIGNKLVFSQIAGSFVGYVGDRQDDGSFIRTNPSSYIYILFDSAGGRCKITLREELEVPVEEQTSATYTGPEGIVYAKINFISGNSLTSNAFTYVGLSPSSYPVTVNKGRAAKPSYEAGAIVSISANTEEAGKQFKEWTVQKGSIALASSGSAITSFIMPMEEVVVTATYEDAPNPTPTPTPNPNPTPYPTPTPNPNLTAYPTPTPIPIAEGKIEKSHQQDEGSPISNVNNTSEELKTRVLTPLEQEMVRRGEDARVILHITDISSSISDEEKRIINEVLALDSSDDERPVLYMDLSLYKQIGDRERTRITETNGYIFISVEVPEGFRNTDITKSREFFIIRIHNNKAIRIDGSYDSETHMFTFETDSFSTYSLNYQDIIKIPTYEGFGYLQLKVKTDKDSQTISYKRVDNIDGYIIYGGKCGQELTELAEVPVSTISYTFKNIEPRTFYKYQVKAYRIVDGERAIIMTSKVVHSIFNGKTYADPLRVTVDTSSLRLAVGEDQTVTGQVVLPKGKKLKAHTRVIRYESTSAEIATVNSKGKIIAKAEGTCYVYAYAQNGVYKRIKVTVK